MPEQPARVACYLRSARLWCGGYLGSDGAQTENWPSTFRESSSCPMSCGCLRISASSLPAPWMPLWLSVTSSISNNSLCVSATTALTRTLRGQNNCRPGRVEDSGVAYIVITSEPDIFEAVKEALHIVTCGLLPLLQGTTAKDAAGLENGRDKGTPEHYSQIMDFAPGATRKLGRKQQIKTSRSSPARRQYSTTIDQNTLL